MNQPWTNPHDGPPASPDVLPAEPARRSSRARRAGLVGLAGVATIAVAGTALATVSFLSGGGAQPEDVLPADVVAFAKIDLDPAAGQKLAAYRLAKKFPSTADDVTDQDRLRDQLLRQLFEGDEHIDYDRDVAPWIGDRAAVAALPVPGAAPVPILAVAHTDRAEADAALRRMEPGDTFWAFSDKADYVLLGETQETVDAAAAASSVLADSGTYRDDVDALEGQHIVTAWADLGALWQALPEESRQTAREEGVELGGRVAVGGRVISEGIEVVGRSFEVTTGAKGTAGIGARAGLDLIRELPDDVVAAVGVTDLGPGLAELYGQLQEGEPDPLGIGAAADAADLSLPDDLRVLFGEQTALGVFSGDQIAVRTRTDDPERAATVAERAVHLLGGGLLGMFGLLGQGVAMEEMYVGEPPQGELHGYDEYQELEPYPFEEEELGEGGASGSWPGEVEQGYAEVPAPGVDGSGGARFQELAADQIRVLDDGIVVGTTAAAVEGMAAGGGGLDRSPSFRRAVPDAGDAGFVLFVDLQRLVELAFGGPTGLTDEPGDVEPLEALGISSAGGENGSFRVRLTVR